MPKGLTLQTSGLQAVVEILDHVPDCRSIEVRLGHRQLLEAAAAQCQIPRELRGSALALLSTAALASPLHPNARSRLWPSIK